MDKNTVGSFLWIVVTIIIMLCLIAFASPFGVYIKDNIDTFTGEYIEDADKSSDDNTTPYVNLTIKYEVPADSGTSIPTYHQTLKKYEKYSIASPHVNGYKPNLDVVSGVATANTEITVLYSLGEYTIKYIANEGEWTDTSNVRETYTYKDSFNLPTTIKRPNYKFEGWYTTKDFSGEKVTKINSTDYGDKVFYAKWVSAEYTINYIYNDRLDNGNNTGSGYYYREKEAKYPEDLAKWDDEVLVSGSLNEKYTKYKYGDQLKLPVNISKFGYTFVGWSTEKDGKDQSKYRTQITETDTGDITLYAQWKRNTYDIVYHLDFIRPNGEKAEYSIISDSYTVLDGDGNIKTYPGYPTKYTYGDTITLPEKIYYPGYQGYIPEQIWFNKKTEKIEVKMAADTRQDGVVSGYPDNMVQKKVISPSTVGFANNDPQKQYDYTDLDLYVKPIPNNYYFDFKRNAPTDDEPNYYFTGQDMPRQTLVYDYTSKINKNTFSYKGYKFTGWNTKADGSGISYSDQQEVLNLTTEPGEVITLYAQWKPLNVNVKYEYYFQNIKGDKFVKDSKLQPDITIQQKADSTQSAKTYAAKQFTGYTFQRVTIQEYKTDTVESKLPYNYRVLPDGSQVIRIYYTRNSYDFTFKVVDPYMIKTATANMQNGSSISFTTGSTTTLSKTVTLKYEEMINLNATYETRYRIKNYVGSDGWSSKSAKTSHAMPADDLTITLYNELNTADVVFHANCGNKKPYSSWSSTVSDKTKTITYTFGYAYNRDPNKGFPEIDRDCYNFLGWYTSPTGGTKISESSVFETNSPLVLYAHWELSGSSQDHRYEVSISDSDCIHTGTKTTKCIDCGHTITETIPAKGHIESKNWIHNKNGTNHYKFCERKGCSFTKANSKPLKTAKHNFTTQTLTTPECYREGSQKHTCRDCGYNYTSSTGKNLHAHMASCSVAHQIAIKSPTNFQTNGHRGQISSRNFTLCNNMKSKGGTYVYSVNWELYCGTCSPECTCKKPNNKDANHWVRYSCFLCKNYANAGCRSNTSQRGKHSDGDICENTGPICQQMWCGGVSASDAKLCGKTQHTRGCNTIIPDTSDHSLYKTINPNHEINGNGTTSKTQYYPKLR